ncbi:hypothetical protein PLICRDRAFT_185708 [Plicaturopsis crispa FD-325 SS-3]|nr:hypothetical protein PLICRDRAFT_185708 [Plicaturopsis crispa FD-325 SS-3]
MVSPIGAAILTISDTASVDESLDKSGPAISTLVAKHGVEIRGYLIVPDDEVQIRQIVATWCELGTIDWVITTGGTGFGVRDRTPEAIKPLLEREATGIVHLLLSASLKHTPLAALSRPVAGTVKNTLVVTLPGSVKAVTENITALLEDGVLNHAIELIRGGSGSSVHASLGAGRDSTTPQPEAHAHHHHHHHHHGHSSHNAPQPRTVQLSHDPSLPVSARHRISPYPLFSFEKALYTIMSTIEPLAVIERPVNSLLRGHVLAEDIFAPQNVPSSQTTSVDGYALRSTDPLGIYTVLTARTHAISSSLPPGSIYRINTGGPLPAGSDTVIMVEDTRLISTHAEDGEEKEVETLAQIPPGENVRAPGSDVKKGDLALPKGIVIRSSGGEIGTLAFVGRPKVHVYRKPVVAILSTGNEIVDLHGYVNPEVDSEWGGIWDTNRPSLQAALEGMGYEVLDLGIVRDNIDAHVEAISQGLERADLLLTTGGTSMGPSDLLKPVIERHFNGTIHFGRVTVKPGAWIIYQCPYQFTPRTSTGKPTTFATIPAHGKAKPVFALPGNPASALVTFHIFVVPALRKLGGWPAEQCQLPRVRVQLHDSMRLDARTEFHRVIIRAGTEGLQAYSTGGQRSSRVASLSGANGLVILPPRVEGGPVKLNVGDLVEAVVIGEIQM